MENFVHASVQLSAKKREEMYVAIFAAKKPTVHPNTLKVQKAGNIFAQKAVKHFGGISYMWEKNTLTGNTDARHTEVSSAGQREKEFVSFVRPPITAYSVCIIKTGTEQIINCIISHGYATIAIFSCIIMMWGVIVVY